MWRSWPTHIANGCLPAAPARPNQTASCFAAGSGVECSGVRRRWAAVDNQGRQTQTGMTRGAFPSRHFAHEGTQSGHAVHVPSREGIAPLTRGFYSPPRFVRLQRTKVCHCRPSTGPHRPRDRLRGSRQPPPRAPDAAIASWTPRRDGHHISHPRDCRIRETASPCLRTTTCTRLRSNIRR